MKFMEEKFVPLAAKIGSQKHLVAIRDAFVVVMPLTIAGAIGVLLNNIGGVFDPTGLNMPSVADGYRAFIANSGLSAIFVGLNDGSLGIMALLIAGLLSYKLTETNGGDAVCGFALGLGCYCTGLPWDWGTTYVTTTMSGPAIEANLLGAQGLFVAMLVGLMVGEIYPRFSKSPSLKISMPDGVPPAVAKSFSSLIPACLTMIIVSAIMGYVQKLTGMTVWAVITKFLATPLQGLSQNVFMIIVMYFMIDILWVFGLHGANIVGSVTTPILSPLGIENTQLFNAGQEPVHTVVGGLQSGFVFMGGSGATLGCIIAIFLFSKSKAAKTIAQLAVAPGLFEINEPLTFGLPIVLNPVYAVPFILGPIILGVVTFYIMEAGIIRRPCVEAPWVTPPVLVGFLCTGGDFKGAIWNVIEIVFLTVLWTPFVLTQDKVEAREAAE